MHQRDWKSLLKIMQRDWDKLMSMLTNGFHCMFCRILFYSIYINTKSTNSLTYSLTHSEGVINGKLQLFKVKNLQILYQISNKQQQQEQILHKCWAERVTHSWISFFLHLIENLCLPNWPNASTWILKTIRKIWTNNSQFKT